MFRNARRQLRKEEYRHGALDAVLFERCSPSIVAPRVENDGRQRHTRGIERAGRDIESVGGQGSTVDAVPCKCNGDQRSATF